MNESALQAGHLTRLAEGGQVDVRCHVVFDDDLPTSILCGAGAPLRTREL